MSLVDLDIGEPLTNAIWAWFTSATGLTVYWEDQNHPRAQKPYGTLRIISGPTKVAGQDEQRIRESDNKIEVSGLRRFTVSCNIFGAGAMGLMAKAQVSLDVPAFLEPLRAAGLSVVDEGPVNNLSTFRETTYETRAQMDVAFLAASVFADEDTGQIEKVEITAEGEVAEDPATQVIPE